MASQYLKEFTDANFPQEVLQSDIPVLVDFTATWCPPCRLIAPIMDKLAGQYAGKVKVGKVDVDANQQSAANYNASSIPLVVLFVGGQPTRSLLGARPESAYKQIIDEALAAAPVK